MAAKRGGEEVATGLYWCRDTWEIVPVSGKPAPLPGPDSHSYLRVPTLGMLLVGPILGGLFVVFLPFIGFALLVYALGARSLQLASSRLRLIRSAPKQAHKPSQVAQDGAAQKDEDDNQRVA